ncbi:MAG: TonB-dependent receptor [Flavitalea sp.]
MFGSALQISAQIRIRIEDGKDRKPLENASVFSEAGRLFISNQGGFVIIDKRLSGKLVISYTGYYPTEINADTISMNEIVVLLRSSVLMNEQVVVTAQRRTQWDRTVPYTVQRTDKKSLDEYLPRTVPEALSNTTGVFIQKTNHGGGSAFVRGLTGNQTLLVYDGVRLNNSIYRYGPNQYLNTIDAYSIGSMEVAKGTGSVQYGSDAIGGVIQLFSQDLAFSEKKSFRGSRFAAKSMTGDMDKTLRGQVNFSNENFAFAGGVTARRFGDLIGGDTTGRQMPSGYDDIANDLKVKFRLNDNSNLTINHNMVDQFDVPVYHKVKLENFAVNLSDKQRRMMQYIRYDLQTNNRLFNSIEITTAHQQNVEKRSSRKNGSQVLRREMDKVTGLSLTGDISSVIKKGWTANSGIEIYRDRVNSTREDLNLNTNAGVSSRGLYPNESAITNYAVYSLHHLSYKKWILDLGLRYHQSDIKIKDTSLGEVNLNPGAVVGNIGLLYAVSKTQSIYASASSGFRAPNIDDLGTLGVVDFRYEVPTGDLSPEKSLHMELGYKLRSRKLSISANLFTIRLQDLITRNKKDDEIINGYPVYSKENTEAANISGAEAEINYAILDGLFFSGSAAYTYGWNETKKEPLRRIPPVHGRLLLRYSKNNFMTGLEYQYAGKQGRLAKGDTEDNRIPVGGTPGFNLVNCYAGYQVKNVSIQLALQNLFNIDYRTHGSGINGYGRSLSLQVLYQIK